MSKFQIYVHEGVAKKERATECYDITFNVEKADAFVLEKKEVEVQNHVFPSIEKAVQSLVCRYVDLVSCSGRGNEEQGNEKVKSLSQAKNSVSMLRKREEKLLNYARQYKIKLSPTGKIILAPSCSGKSFWLKKNQGWQDLDDIASEFKLHGERYAGLPHTEEQQRKHYTRIDTWLATMQRLGFHVLGSLYEAFEADAVVIIDEETHRKYTDKREDVSWESAKKQRLMLLELAESKKIRVYPTINKAVADMENA